MLTIKTPYQTSATQSEVSNISDWLDDGLRDNLYTHLEVYFIINKINIKDNEIPYIDESSIKLHTIGLFCTDGNPYMLDISFKYSLLKI